MSAIDAVQRAASAVWPGAELVDAEAFLDHLDDEGYRVTARVRQDGPGLFDEVPQ